jgi:HlyD family secretion protein
VYQAVPVERRSIVVSVRAAGQVQPDTVVEVKSKASGEILDIHVETGQLVNRGDLLVRIDQRTVRNQFAEAEATLEVARARLANAESQKRRADELFKAQSITQEELENAVLTLANAKAEEVRAQVALDNARIQLDDTDVRAPITGTIITKSVERGQVISSPTRDVGGGTVLLTMADLGLVQVRTLVDETDIGKVRPGMAATVTVDAYPNQPFRGEVLKIEPKAETVQNVTMFPVMVRINNQNGLLKPGMNTDVEIHVGQRDNVLAIPNAALRTQRDVQSAAQVLGISEDRLAALMEAANTLRDSLQRTAGADRDSSVRITQAAGAAPEQGAGATGGSAAASAPSGNTMTTPDGRTIQLPEGVTEQQVRALFRKRFSGEQLSAKEQQVLQQVSRSMGGNRGAGGGPGGAGFAGGARRMQGSTTDYEFGGSYIVFVLRNREPVPTHIRTGLTDLDYSEVVSGLEPSDSVIILPSASLVRSQQEFQQRAGRMAGQGVPGMRQEQPSNTPPQQPQPAGARPPGGR